MQPLFCYNIRPRSSLSSVPSGHTPFELRSSPRYRGRATPQVGEELCPSNLEG